MRVRTSLVGLACVLSFAIPAKAQQEPGGLLGGLPEDPAEPNSTESAPEPPPPPDAAAPQPEAPGGAEASGEQAPNAAATPAPAVAPSQSGPLPEDPLVTRAVRALFKAATSAFQRGDYESAATWFSTAYDLKPHPDVLLNLATAETEAGRNASAANHWSAYLESAPPEESANAKKTLEQLRTKVGVVKIIAPDGRRLQVDYKNVGIAPLEQAYYVSPGPHIVSAGSEHRTVTVDARKTQTVDFLTADAGVANLNDQVQDQTGAMETLPEWFMDTPPAWATAGLSVAGILVATYTGLNASRSFSAHDDAANQIRTQWQLDNPGSGTPCGPPAFDDRYAHACAVLKQQQADGRDWRTAAWISMGVGAAAAGGTLLYYYLDRERKSSKSAKKSEVQAMLAPGFGALEWRGAF